VSAGRRPPRLLVKTLTVTFITVAGLLVVVFLGVTVSVRDRVRQTVAGNLESSQRMFAALETRRERELRSQAASLAENPTLKAALDTYVAEAGTTDESSRMQLLATVSRELDKLAARVEADAIVVVDARQNILQAAGRLADRWSRGRRVTLVDRATGAAQTNASETDGIVQLSDTTFRVMTVPLVLENGAIGSLYLATSLDQGYADALYNLSRTDIAIISDNLMLASTMTPQAGREFEAAIARSKAVDGTMDLDGESHAFRRLVQVANTSFYAIGSIDEAARAETREAMRVLALIAVGATLLALIGSFWLARLLTEPVGRLSTSLAQMAAARDVDGRLPLTGSSRELDTLTETFNALMASVSAAETETQAAYTGAIRALAMALDARDPYTAGHSERVSVLSVGIGRALNLTPEELEVLRLGALLHDIGKIGVPDEVLRKAGSLTAAEYDTIKQHPVLGARILRSVPFLSHHIPIVELHHERPDGRGYPFGLRDQDIPLAARIVHVADAYDAMTSARAYRRARPAGEALRELWRCAGTEFHAEVVGALAVALPGVTSQLGEPAYESIGG
jgi:putative nucleotidyltransferase with HDIG domain